MDAADALFDSPSTSAPAPSTTPSPSTNEAPALDLSGADADTEAARQQLLLGGDDKKKRKGGKGSQFDFGGGIQLDLGGDGAVDFGGELEDFDLETFQVDSAERNRFDEAMEMMADEDYDEASIEFRYFLEDNKFTEFHPESEYQLAKALYKMGFYDIALDRFRIILNQGASHRRYRKSIEWLFFISRKLADQTPVLKELAQFRNVTFPKAYRNEYKYLLAKYLFIQAEKFEVDRIQQRQLARSKKQTDAIDFSTIEDMAAADANFDFSSFDTSAFDFGGAEDEGMDFGGGGAGMDFGGGGAGMDFGGGGAGMDFGGGGESMDFGGAEDEGMDFGGGDEAMDFGATTPDAGDKEDKNAPMREKAPQTAKDAIRQGVDLITEVDESSKFYTRAKYLEGLLNYLGGVEQNAVSNFQDVVRLLNPREAEQLDPQVREMAFLSLARIHYGHRQFSRSVYYYDHIDRDSENWLTALFEASWAYYRRGDYEKALGNLLTLHSPFFESEYFPESQLVKAIIYYEACRYTETRVIVDDFLKRYTKVMKEIQRIAESSDAPELLYDKIVQIQNLTKDEDAADEVTTRVMSLAINDPQIKIARDVIQQTKEQLELWETMSTDFRENKLGRDMYEKLNALLNERSQHAGVITKEKFERELYQLKSLLAQAISVKIEVVRAEREYIQRELRGEDSLDKVIIPAVARTVVGDEQLYWPYEGEYWRDELGNYELDFSMCRPLASP